MWRQWVLPVLFFCADSQASTHFKYMTNYCSQTIEVFDSLIVVLVPPAVLRDDRKLDYIHCRLDLLPEEGHSLHVHFLHLSISPQIKYTDRLKLYSVGDEKKKTPLTPDQGLYGMLDRSLLTSDASGAKIEDYSTEGEGLQIEYLGKPTKSHAGFRVLITSVTKPSVDGECPSSSFACSTRPMCIAKELVCDAYFNCGAKDNADEKGCDFNHMVTDLSEHYSLMYNILVVTCLPVTVFLVASFLILCLGRCFIKRKYPTESTLAVRWSNVGDGLVQMEGAEMEEESPSTNDPPPYSEVVSFSQPPDYSSLEARATESANEDLAVVANGRHHHHDIQRVVGHHSRSSRRYDMTSSTSSIDSVGGDARIPGHHHRGISSSSKFMTRPHRPSSSQYGGYSDDDDNKNNNNTDDDNNRSNNNNNGNTMSMGTSTTTTKNQRKKGGKGKPKNKRRADDILLCNMELSTTEEKISQVPPVICQPTYSPPPALSLSGARPSSNPATTSATLTSASRVPYYASPSLSVASSPSPSSPVSPSSCSPSPNSGIISSSSAVDTTTTVSVSPSAAYSDTNAQSGGGSGTGSASSGDSACQHNHHRSSPANNISSPMSSSLSQVAPAVLPITGGSIIRCNEGFNDASSSSSQSDSSSGAEADRKKETDSGSGVGSPCGQDGLKQDSGSNSEYWPYSSENKTTAKISSASMNGGALDKGPDDANLDQIELLPVSEGNIIDNVDGDASGKVNGATQQAGKAREQQLQNGGKRKTSKPKNDVTFTTNGRATSRDLHQSEEDADVSCDSDVDLDIDLVTVVVGTKGRRKL